MVFFISTRPTRLSICSVVVVGCMALAFDTCSANVKPPVADLNGAVKASELPHPPGILGYSRYIDPLEQDTRVEIYYPNSAYAAFKDHVSYALRTSIKFQCTQATKRIVLNVNPLSNISSVSVFTDFLNNTSAPVPVQQYFYNTVDNTLVVDAEVNMRTEYTHTIRIIYLTQAIIDQDDSFGIQAFKRVNTDTGEELITVGLSPAPNVMRRFMPCFDDPFYKLVYYWTVIIRYGTHPPVFVEMNVRYTGTGHTSPVSSPNSWIDYDFELLGERSVETTMLRITPCNWFGELCLLNN